jgi:hypothetical protein
VYGIHRRAEPAGYPSAAGAMKGVRRRRRPPLPRSYWLLMILFLGLQVGDIVTTNYALALPGVWEANPVMASYQAQLGALWWLPKAAMVAWICVAAPLTRRWWPMVFAVGYYGVIVAGNLALL